MISQLLQWSLSEPMTFDEFCIRLKKLNLTQPQQGLAILWFMDNASPWCWRTGRQIAKLAREAGVSEPNVTRLGEQLGGGTYVLKKGDRFILKPVYRDDARMLVETILESEKPKADQDKGYLPKAVWKYARPYIQTIAEEINSCYEFDLPNAASVLLRRLLETVRLSASSTKRLLTGLSGMATTKCSATSLRLPSMTLIYP